MKRSTVVILEESGIQNNILFQNVIKFGSSPFYLEKKDSRGLGFKCLFLVLKLDIVG